MTVEERLERVETLYMAIARHLGIDADAQVHADDDAYERAIQALAAGDRRPTIGEPEAGRAPAPAPKAEEELLRSETEAFAMGTDLERWIRAGLPPALLKNFIRRGGKIPC
jgi:hypothetical protein